MQINTLNSIHLQFKLFILNKFKTQQFMDSLHEFTALRVYVRFSSGPFNGQLIVHHN